MAQPSKGQSAGGALGSGTLQAALQKQRNLQQRVDSDLNSLVENFSNMVAACKIQDQTRNTQEAFQIDVHVARITQVTESLLDVVSELKQSAIFSNFEARNEKVAGNIAKYEEQVDADSKEIDSLQKEIADAQLLLKSSMHNEGIGVQKLQTLRAAG